MPDQPTYDCFLSYARDDDGRADRDDPTKSFARRLYDGLTAAGLKVWWDHVCLPSRGLAFDDEIRAAIDQCNRLVLIFGPAVKESSYVWDEVEYALETCKLINPILRKSDYPDIPERLKRLRLHTPDFRDDAKFDERLRDLLQNIREDPVLPLGRLYNVPTLPKGYVRRQVIDDLEAIVRRDAGKTAVLTARAPTTADQSSTLYGMGGVGKSTLALALAHDCDVRRAFPDGVFYLELGKQPSIAALQHLIGSQLQLGESLDLYQNEQAGRSRLTHLLENRAALIVLDNVWDKAHADWFIVNAPRTRFLVTTRSQRLAGLLTDSAHTLQLDVLSADEAAALIANWLEWKGTDPHPDDALHRRIAETVGRHALAVRIAAAHLNERGAAYAPKLLERLQKRKEDNPFKDLDLGDNKDVNVEISLAESYEALNDDLKWRFRQLGVFAEEGTFDVYAVALIWGDKNFEDSKDALNELVQMSLLTQFDKRYHQHSLLRVYARALLIQAGEMERAALARFLHYSLTYSDEEFNQTLHPASSITADFDNISEILYWGFEQAKHNVSHANTATDVTFALSRYLQLKTSVEQRNALFNAALNAASTTNYIFGQANACKAIADLYVFQGKLREAMAQYKRAIELYTHIDHKLGKANAALALGDLFNRILNNRQAHELLDLAREMYIQIDLPLGQANALLGIGRLQTREGDLEHAKMNLEHALRIYVTIEETLGQAHTFIELGEVAFLSDQWKEAKEHYEKARSLFEKGHSWLGSGNALRALGELFGSLREFKQAHEYLTCSIEHYQRAEDKLGIANSLRSIGILELQLKNMETAKEYLERALVMFKELDELLGQSITLTALGSILAFQGNHQEALTKFTLAAEPLLTLNYPYHIATLYASCAPSYLAVGRYRDAIDCLRQSWLLYFKAGAKRQSLDAGLKLKACRHQIGPEAFDAAWAQVTGGQPLPDWLA